MWVGGLLIAPSGCSLVGHWEHFCWSDGVVAYWSSHLAGAQSELIVPDGHGSFALPQTVSELKRILRFHLSLKTEMAPDSAGVRSGLVSLSDRFESSSGIYSSR